MAKIGLNIVTLAIKPYFRRICIRSQRNITVLISPHQLALTGGFLARGLLSSCSFRIWQAIPVTSQIWILWRHSSLLYSRFENQLLNAILVFESFSSPLYLLCIGYRLESLRLKARNFGGSQLLDNIQWTTFSLFNLGLFFHFLMLGTNLMELATTLKHYWPSDSYKKELIRPC